MPVWKTAPQRGSYDASAVKNQNPLQNHKMAKGITTVRSERGYLATNYDASAAKLLKTLRCHFGQKSTMGKKCVTIIDASAAKR